MMDKQAFYDFVAQRTEKCKILVIGDVMLDKYYYGEVTRISPEAPVPITHVKSQKETLGGAANVAHNLALLGCDTSLVGYVGNDYHCQTLTDKLAARGINFEGLVHTDAPTTTKMRIIGDHQQMLRLDFEDDHPIDGAYAERLMDYVSKRLNASLDAVILSDYGKGLCTEQMCQRIIKESHAHGVPVLIDPKGANWIKYAGADFLTPNLKEINAVLLEPIKNNDDAVERAAYYVMRKFKIKNIIVTRSAAGLTIISGEDIHHIPTRAQEVFDVSGAGDTVIAVFTLALAGGMKPADAAYLANLAASVVIAKLGTYAVSKEELLGVLKRREREQEHKDEEEMA